MLTDPGKAQRDWERCIRRARALDAPSLHANCFSQDKAESVRDGLYWCLARVAEGRMVRLVAQVDGAIVASGQLDLVGSRAEIGSLVVAPTYRQQGLGTAMVRALIRAARDMRASAIEIAVDADASWLRAWYERLGFVYLQDRLWPRNERVAILRLGDPPAT